MDELTALCRRLLGDPVAAETVAQSAGGGETRVAQLRTALQGCRAARPDSAQMPASAPGNGGLAAAVARELAEATARLPQRQQEALALRELLGFSHELIAEVLAIEPAAVAALLARARLRLRAELRNDRTTVPRCPERDRMLRTATLRQDGLPVSEDDEDWLVDHLGHCEGCRRTHSSLLEGSVNYRAWSLRASDPQRDPTADAGAGAATERNPAAT